MNLKKYFILLVCLPAALNAQGKYPYQDTKLSFEERAKDLVSRMALEEKISQMVYNSPAIERLGVPAYNWWNEALHGVARNGVATVFPQAIGMAATWDAPLMFKISTVISDEARAKYNKALKKGSSGIYEGITLWSPNINIFRDPRWGRGMETYGEDPYLTGELAKQFVQGLQGSNDKYLKTIATPKHLAAHSGPEPLRHGFNAEVSEYDLRETYLPQFKKALMEGHAYSVMCAYNRLRGRACCGSDPLLNDILRNEWGFKGLVVSDCWAVSDIFNFHKIVETGEEAASLSVKAGTDLECGNAYPTLNNAIKQGLITEAELDTAVERVFAARFKLGMFDPQELNPYSKLDKYDTKENKAVALAAARKSIVLLKNDKNALPLNKNIKKIAVLGPNANDVEVLLGNYNGFPSNPVTPYQGIKNKLANAEVVYERGCELTEGMPSFELINGKNLYTSEDKKEHGLRGEYFDNRDWSGAPVFTRVDKDVNFFWWDGSPDSRINPDNYGVRWSGVLVPETTGKYALGGYGFNGFRIYLEDTLLVKFDGEFDPQKTYKYVNLTAGKAYKIKMEFYRNMRYAFMQLIWSAPDVNLEQRALSLAKNSDAVVMVMGLSPRLEGEELSVKIKGFEGGDRLTLNLPETQLNFMKKVKELGKPMVLVLLNGSAVSVNWENENIPAIVEAWYPGQAAGEAIADVLFGDYNPAGRLPVTFYKSVEQLPDFTNYDMQGRTYRYFKGEPLYPFGYGLSYANFEYTNIKLSKDRINANGSAIVSVDVKNTGKMKGDEVVQLYIKADKDDKAVKTLKGFERITLNPGEVKTVSFEITPDKLTRWVGEKGFSIEEDNYTVMLGSSSGDKDLHKVKLTVSGDEI
ncbi:MAG TPA: glycoside hydrolase family 3 C-terminal domain-containing protein [Ignavibacteriales bacterium]|nr:glycoside hydrolase family 3 C-terminal domain-containing protein [Ignavibacteriales bacterium]